MAISENIWPHCENKRELNVCLTRVVFSGRTYSFVVAFTQDGVQYLFLLLTVIDFFYPRPGKKNKKKQLHKEFAGIGLAELA